MRTVNALIIREIGTQKKSSHFNKLFFEKNKAVSLRYFD